jgi:predicted ATPase/DNA-binding SARP family transcriptional activator
MKNQVNDTRHNLPGTYPGVELHLLGEFSVAVNGAEIPKENWHSKKVRNLIKLLALAPGHHLHRDQVLETLWPDAGMTAAVNLFYQALHAARKILGPTPAAAHRYLSYHKEILSLCPDDPLWIDVEAFEEQVSIAHQSKSLSDHLRARDLYQGELLPEDRYETWTLTIRRTVNEQYINLLLEIARMYEEQQDYVRAVELLKDIIELDPVCEQAYARLMFLYVRLNHREQALQSYQQLVENLRSELDVAPGQHIVRLYQDIATGRLDISSLNTAVQYLVSGQPCHNLPGSLTSFIGREKEIGEVARLVRGNRLMTLVGAGGVGKTRLAVRVGEELLAEFQQGVFIVEMAAISSLDVLVDTCARVLGVPEQPNRPIEASIQSYLEKKHFLLIIDNCEHLLEDTTKFVMQLMLHCPMLHILTTSRELLALPGEMIYYVPSLGFPDPQQGSPLESLQQFESVQLFVDRASLACSGFQLDQENAAAISIICRQLDGIPLAIELAAARVRILTPQHIASRLDDLFTLLNGGSKGQLPRHQTLQASISWSYELLSAEEQNLLQLLSVFAGSWSLTAAEAMGASRDILAQLGALVDKSMIIFDSSIQDDQPRYRMLEIIRQYARRKLDAADGAQFAQKRHFTFYRRLAAQAEPCLRGKDMKAWFIRLEREMDNLRLAVNWAIVHDVEGGMVLVTDLWWFWHIRNHWKEAYQWLQRLLELESAGWGVEQMLVRGKARLVAALLKCNYSFMSASDYRKLEEAIDQLRTAGEEGLPFLGLALIYRAFIWPEDEKTEEYLQQGYTLLQTCGSCFHQSEGHRWSFLVFMRRGQYDLAEAAAQQALKLAQEIGDEDGIAVQYYQLARHAQETGKFAQAIDYDRKAINGFHVLGNYLMESTAILHLFETRLYLEDHEFIDQNLGFLQRLALLTGERNLEAHSLAYRGLALANQEKYYEALLMFLESTRIYAEIGDVVSYCFGLLWKAGLWQILDNEFQTKTAAEEFLCCCRQEWESVSRGLPLYIPLFNAAFFSWKNHPAYSVQVISRLSSDRTSPLFPFERRRNEIMLSRIRAEIGDGAYYEAWSRGSEVDIHQACRKLLGCEPFTG